MRKKKGEAKQGREASTTPSFYTFSHVPLSFVLVSPSLLSHPISSHLCFELQPTIVTCVCAMLTKKQTRAEEKCDAMEIHPNHWTTRSRGGEEGKGKRI